MSRAAIALLVVLVACGRRSTPPVPLADELTTLAGADQATREAAVAAWKLDRAAWTATVVAPYGTTWDDYARAFDAAAPALAAQLANRGAIATRMHYAGDPQLTRGQARARWALPVQFPSEVATLAGSPIDTVFVRAGEHWRAIVGIDQIVLARTTALDAACAHFLETLGTKACQEIGWVIGDAALRADRSRLAHACSLAKSQCAP